MTRDAILVLQTLFGTIWRLFTSWHIPGTNVTPAAAFLFFIAVGIGLKFVGRIIGQNIDINGARDSFVDVQEANKPKPFTHFESPPGTWLKP